MHLNSKRESVNVKRFIQTEMFQTTQKMLHPHCAAVKSSKAPYRVNTHKGHLHTHWHFRKMTGETQTLFSKLYQCLHSNTITMYRLWRSYKVALIKAERRGSPNLSRSRGRTYQLVLCRSLPADLREFPCSSPRDLCRDLWVRPGLRTHRAPEHQTQHMIRAAKPSKYITLLIT